MNLGASWKEKEECINSIKKLLGAYKKTNRKIRMNWTKPNIKTKSHCKRLRNWLKEWDYWKANWAVKTDKLSKALMNRKNCIN